MRDEWENDFRRNRHGLWRTWAIAVGGAVIGTPLVWFGYRAGGTGGVALALLGSLLLSIAFVYGTFVYMRRIDEQERMANLWAAYVSLTVYSLLFAINFLLTRMGTVIPGADLMIFAATGATVLLVFCWLRFR